MAKRKNTLPAFTPVPRKCERHDGWTPERQQGFIDKLADYGNVRAAANAVGMTPESAYLLRRHPEAKGFRKAWKAALVIGIAQIEDVAMDRALNGVEVPVYCYGKFLGMRRKHNDRLLMFMLRNRAPKRFAEGGARGLSAVDKPMLARLRKQWRKEWAAEQRAREPDIDEVRAEIQRKVEAIQAAERTRWTPREHELHAALAEERGRRKAREEAEAHDRFERDQTRWQQPAEPDGPALIEPPAPGPAEEPGEG